MEISETFTKEEDFPRGYHGCPSGIGLDNGLFVEEIDTITSSAHVQAFKDWKDRS